MWQFDRNNVAFGMDLFPQLGIIEYISYRRTLFVSLKNINISNKELSENTRKFRHNRFVYALSTYFKQQQKKLNRPFEELMSVFVL